MTQTAWILTPEPTAASAVRAGLAPEAAAEKVFWDRDDLTYLGDLAWCDQAAMRGLEYIANIQVTADQITYQYGLINLDPADAIASSLVCDVRASRQSGHAFEMLINGEWLQGPLAFWLDQLAPEVQDLARERYSL